MARKSADSTSPSYKAVAVTPNDSTDIPVTRGLYIGGSGDVVVHMERSGTSLTFAGAQAGSVIPIQVDRVLATGTTATGIVALY